MNRHERRRAEAQQRAQELRSQKDAKPMKATTDKGFGEYRDFYRKAFCGASDRAIGEGFMRGERIAAAGAEHMVIYLHGESPSPPVEDDLWFSVAYGPQRFLARTPRRHLLTLVDTWPQFRHGARETSLGELLAKIDAQDVIDGRCAAREYILHSIVENFWGHPQVCAVTAAAVAWLVKGSPVGLAFGETHNVAHYEITAQLEPSRSHPDKCARNFRLVLARKLTDLPVMQTLKIPVPQW